MDNLEFVTIAIQEFVGNSHFLDFPFRPKVVDLLSVASYKGKNRLILDLTSLRELLKNKKKTKLGNLSKTIFVRMVTCLNLNCNPHHISIYTPHLGFSLVITGEPKYSVFTAVPF